MGPAGICRAISDAFITLALSSSFLGEVLTLPVAGWLMEVNLPIVKLVPPAAAAAAAEAALKFPASSRSPPPLPSPLGTSSGLSVGARILDSNPRSGITGLSLAMPLVLLNFLVCLSNLFVSASLKVVCTLLSFATSFVVSDLLVRWEAVREVGAEARWAVLSSSLVSRAILALAIDVLVCGLLGAGEGVGEGLFSREVLALAMAVRVMRLVGAGEGVGERYEEEEIDIGCLGDDVGLDGLDGLDCSLTSLFGALA